MSSGHLALIPHKPRHPKSQGSDHLHVTDLQDEDNEEEGMEGEYDEEDGEDEEDEDEDGDEQEDFEGLEAIRGQLDPDDVVFVSPHLASCNPSLLSAIHAAARAAFCLVCMQAAAAPQNVMAHQNSQAAITALCQTWTAFAALLLSRQVLAYFVASDWAISTGAWW